MSEVAPEFAQTADLILFVTEGLISNQIPWKTWLNPERVARAMRAAEFRVSLHAIGDRDPIKLVHRMGEMDAAAGAIGMEALEELEIRWLLRQTSEVIAGLHELVLHLESSGKKIAFASAMAEPVALQAIQSRLGTMSTMPVFGRLNAADLPTVYSTVIRRAIEANSSERCCLVVHQSIAWAVDITVLPCSALIVGSGSQASEETLLPDVIDLASQCDLTLAERGDVDKRVARRDRINELRTLNSLTNEQMAEYVDLTGGIRYIGNADMFGYVDSRKGAANVALIKKHRESAAEHQHLLEVISIDAILLEVELRNWLIVHREQSFTAELRITFGQMVDLAERNNFSPSLVLRMRAFNRLRNEAIHHLARGISSYYDMTDRYMEDASLIFDIEDFVHESAPVFGRSAERYQ